MPFRDGYGINHDVGDGVELLRQFTLLLAANAGQVKSCGAWHTLVLLDWRHRKRHHAPDVGYLAFVGVSLVFVIMIPPHDTVGLVYPTGFAWAFWLARPELACTGVDDTLDKRQVIGG